MTDDQNGFPAPDPNPDNEAEFAAAENLLGLEGIDDRFLTTHTAARLDLFRASKSVELDSIAPDSLVTVTTAAGDVLFHKPPESDDPDRDPTKTRVWSMIDHDIDGHPIETPVFMFGSAMNPTGTFAEVSDNPHFTMDHYFNIGVIHRFKHGGEEGVPELDSLVRHVDDVDPQIVKENIAMGRMEQTPDRGLVWVSSTGFTLNKVESVTAVPLEGPQKPL